MSDVSLVDEGGSQISVLSNTSPSSSRRNELTSGPAPRLRTGQDELIEEYCKMRLKSLRKLAELKVSILSTIYKAPPRSSSESENPSWTDISGTRGGIGAVCSG